MKTCILDELFELQTIKEEKGKLKKKQRQRYLQIVTFCEKNNIEIPF